MIADPWLSLHTFVVVYDPVQVSQFIITHCLLLLQLKKDGTTWKPMMKRENSRLEQAMKDGDLGPVVIENGRYKVSRER